jgi:alanine racemase
MRPAGAAPSRGVRPSAAPARPTIDLGAAATNWRALDALSAPAVETAAVVKADAYPRRGRRRPRPRTIGYEILTSLGPRYERVYKGRAQRPDIS